MTFPVTSIYAIILAVAAIALSLVVSTKRGKTGIAIFHGDNADLGVWIRKHGNFTETVPFALLLMALAEARAMPSLWLNVLGVLLVAARILHVIGLDAKNPAGVLRVAGGSGTLLTMLGASAYLAWSLA